MIARPTVVELLVGCHRRCCICHRFCGFKMELHHIEQSADGGTDDTENLIPLCFDCHAEMNLYNNKHPRGRKYFSDELKAHRDQWLELCKTSAEFLASVPLVPDVGPLQGLYNELCFNHVVAMKPDQFGVGAQFEISQFSRCVSEGIFSLIEKDVTAPIYNAYFAIKHANALIEGRQYAPDEKFYKQRTDEAGSRIRMAEPLIRGASEKLDTYLGMSTAK